MGGNPGPRELTVVVDGDGETVTVYWVSRGRRKRLPKRLEEMLRRLCLEWLWDFKIYMWVRGECDYEDQLQLFVDLKKLLAREGYRVKCTKTYGDGTTMIIFARHSVTRTQET